MAWFGLVLLGLIGVALVFTGLPAFVVLIVVSIVGAGAGMLAPSVPIDLLNALPGRLIGLFENDLLQALPLFVLMGALLDRLRVIDSLFNTSVAMLGRGSTGPLVSGMALGALMGPMNGSVGASVMALSRAVAPRLAASGVPPPARHAAIAIAATFGVVIPPSLVLILLGDATTARRTVAGHVARSDGYSGRSVRTVDRRDDADAAAAHLRHRPFGFELDHRHSGQRAVRRRRGARRDRPLRVRARRLRDHLRHR